MHFVEKETVKTMPKGGYTVYEYILANTGWWSIFWVVRGGRYILAGGGLWWVVVDIFWLMVDGGGWW